MGIAWVRFCRGRACELHLRHYVRQALAQDLVLLLRRLLVGRSLGDLLGEFGAHDKDEPVLDEDEVAPLCNGWFARRRECQLIREHGASGEQGVAEESTVDKVGGERRALNAGIRSEEHTSELQSPCNLVCR